MKYYVFFIYILILFFNFNFVLSKDIIGSEGIPSHWKRYHEPINNPKYHKPHYLSSKVLYNKLNDETNLQDLSRMLWPKALPFYKISPPTLNNLLYKNLQSNINVDAKILPLSDNNIVADRQNDESNKVGNRNEKNEEEKSRATEGIADKTSKHENTEHTFKPSDKAIFRRGNSEQKSMNIVHHHRKIPLRQTRQMDSSSYPEKREFRDENLEKESEVEELHMSKQITRRSEIEPSENLQKDNDENEEFRRDEVSEDREQNDDNGRRTGNIGLIRPMYLHPFNDPRGWIQYRFMPNRFSPLKKPYINQMYPYTKDPLYNQQA